MIRTPAATSSARPLDAAHPHGVSSAQVAARGEAECPHGRDCAGCGVHRCKGCGVASCRIALTDDRCIACASPAARMVAIARVPLRRTPREPWGSVELELVEPAKR